MSTDTVSPIHFTVEWGGSRIGCTRVSGLEIAYDDVAYREGSASEYGDRKLPGRPRYANLVLERGVVPGDNEFFAWLNTIQLGSVERRDVSVSLLDENHDPAVVWKVKNAWPVRLAGPTLDARGTGVATETLELAHEGYAVESVDGDRK
ncbi:MAG: phage tail protein [Methanobacteriota archaeon]